MNARTIARTLVLVAVSCTASGWSYRRDQDGSLLHRDTRNSGNTNRASQQFLQLLQDISERQQPSTVIYNPVFPEEASPTYAATASVSVQCSQKQCLPPIYCKDIIAGTTLQNSTTSCQLSDRSIGVCCLRDFRTPFVPNRTPFNTPGKYTMPPLFVSNNMVNEACENGISYATRQLEMSRRLLDSRIAVRPNTASAGHYHYFRSPVMSQVIGNQALLGTKAAQRLHNRLDMSDRDIGLQLQHLTMQNTIINGTCPASVVCDRSMLFRSADGSCNNLKQPTWGQSNTALQRILAPDYADGIFEPRVASDGRALPSPREVSNCVIGNQNRPYTELSIGVMTFSQFLDHDISLSPIFTLDDSKGIECCGEDGNILPDDLLHPQCLPIIVPRDDPVFSKGRPLTCLNFVRSLPALRADCSFGYAEQLNSLTQYLDASQVYGSTQQQADDLRSFRGGRLRTSRPGALPEETEGLEDCFATDLGAPCFRAGDGRVNENLQLTIMHTIWLREHNRVAGELEKLARREGEPLRDEQLYQETRRIVIAEWQHIIYNEWLPIVLGIDYMEDNSIRTRASGYSSEYMEHVNPSVHNEFSTAAFRFGHTLIQQTVKMFRSNESHSASLRLKDLLNNPSMITNNRVASFVARGFMLQESQKFDSNIVDDVRNNLFVPSHGGHGMDLVALNLQRGREHGIPGYNSIRPKCGLRRVNSFSDLARSGEITPEVVRQFEVIYRSVDDIDLFVAGIAEKPVPGALLGPTFLCIIGDQFTRLKKGDRFFYDIGGQPHSFSKAQLFEIRKTSWARILCDNMPGLTQVQPLAFYVPNSFNRLTKCSDYAIPQISMQAFA